MKNIRRKIGYIALAVVVISIICLASMISGDYEMEEIQPVALTYAFGCIVAFVCLIGDVIRFIGKCFSQGFNGTQNQGNGRFCTNCSKPIDNNAKFCSHCGSKQDANA